MQNSITLRWHVGLLRDVHRGQHGPRENPLGASRLLLALAVAASLMPCSGCGRATSSSGSPTAGLGEVADTVAVTFNKDIAPLIWENCSGCHRPGEAAPFSLLTYDDVRRRAEQIVDVTHDRYMPPWLAEQTEFRFEDELRLSDQQLALLAAWLRAGTPQGQAADLPKPPEWTEGWNLGEPDLVVQMEEAFTLPPAGPDVYRNFVVPVPLRRPRYVRAMEFRPGNFGIVHHAFILSDPTLRLRRLREADGQPGFDGMDTQGAEPPDGHFIGWQPGRRPYVAPAGMSWRLDPGTDLVIQVHMQPTGKVEQLRASVGLYFTDEPPVYLPLKIGLRSIDIDIPAGVHDYTIRDEFTLPIDVTVLAVAPHAHYLGKKMYGTAVLPDGTTKTILDIQDWDPNWQREYRYREPLFLPKGTQLVQEFTYDNSTANPRNPHSPPQDVRYGLQATDEMGSLWFQVLPQAAEQRGLLERALVIKGLRESKRRFEAVLKQDPDDVHALIEMGKIALITHSADQAAGLFRRATQADPASADAHYYLGQSLLRTGQETAGRAELEQTLELDDRYLKAHHDLGWADFLNGDLAAAERRFRAALAIRPYDALVLDKLGIVLSKTGRYREAKESFELALESQPNKQELRQRIRQMQELLTP